MVTNDLYTTGSGTALNEFNTRYADGMVETYLAVPEVATAFTVNLRSKGYIAPGIAMFVCKLELAQHSYCFFE